MLTVVALALVGLFVLSFTSDAAPANGQVVTGQYIVMTETDVDPSDVVAEHGLAARHIYRAALNGFAAAVPNNKLAGLRDDPRVLVVEQERIYFLDAQEVPTGIDRIEVDKNLSADIDQTDDMRVDLDVAIIDTGLDEDHPDLNIAGGANFSGGPSSKWNDGNGHGTHVGGTVGAIDNGFGVVGMAPGVRLHAVKVCKNGGICFTGDIVAGIEWVTEQKIEFKSTNGASGINFAVANMSISTSDDANSCAGSSGAVHEAICGLVDEGVVFVMAAGNEGRLKNAYPEALAVSAAADFDGLAGGAGSPTCRSDEDDTLANFSNFGPEVDIAAPGVCILSTWNDGGLNTISGTSMAAPHVAGAAALYIHANDTISPATDAEGVEAIESAIIGAALPEGSADNECSYNNERGSTEPLLFVNSTTFGGDGMCDQAGTPTPVTDIAITIVSAPNSVAQGDVVNVAVTVQNVGNQNVADDIVVDLTDMPNDAVILSQTISGLVANASAILNFSWDTEGSTPGDHTLTANHDFSDEDAGNDLGFTVVSVTQPGASLHVGDLDGSSKVKGKSGKWEAFVTVTVHDDSENPVANASIEGSWNGAASGTVSGITAGDGTVTFSTGNLSSGSSVTFTVTDISHSLSYEAGSNHDPDGPSDSDGTVIVIPK